MAFKTFVAGNPLSAADVNNYLMKQVAIQCTSTTLPASPSAGMVVYLTDLDVYWYWNGSAWTEWALATGASPWTAYNPTWRGTSAPMTATLGNGGSFTGRYRYLDKHTVKAQALLSIGSSAPTPPGGTYTFDLPVVASAPWGTNTPLGVINFIGSTKFHGWVQPATSSLAQAFFDGQTSAAAAGNPSTWGQAVSVAFDMLYEV